jgi:hypothetical protein
MMEQDFTPIRKRPFGALLLAFARAPIGPPGSFDSGAKSAPSLRMTTLCTLHVVENLGFLCWADQNFTDK